VAIGIKLTPDSLVLTEGRDFIWAFQNIGSDGQTPEDFPVGELFIELDTGESPTVWDFIIVDDVASLKIESTAADLIPARTEWQLVWLPDGEPAGGEAVAIGTVRRQG
jgi:hypothetical protein